MDGNRLWGLVSIFCLVCVLATAFSWYRAATDSTPQADALTDQQAVEAVLEDFEEREETPDTVTAIPTGLFIQSIRFLNSSDVNFTGHIWQRYEDGLSDDISRGFLFPEQVQSGETVIEELYRRPSDGHEVIGWYFDVTVRQTFDYTNFPLDRHDVWLRLWHRDFDRGIVLTPDLQAYDTTAAGKTFGVDQSITPGGFVIAETYFDYELAEYDTDFGIDSFVGQQGLPELHFRVVVIREVLDILVIRIMPLLVVAVLLFGLLMSMTTDEEQSERFGFDNLAVLGAASALLFVVIIAHMELRDEFPGSGILYLEYYFFVLYAAVVLVGLLAYLFSYEGARRIPVSYHFVSKVTFWPLIIGSLTAITLLLL